MSSGNGYISDGKQTKTKKNTVDSALFRRQEAKRKDQSKKEENELQALTSCITHQTEKRSALSPPKKDKAFYLRVVHAAWSPLAGEQSPPLRGQASSFSCDACLEPCLEAFDELIHFFKRHGVPLTEARRPSAYPC